jgi:tripartite-type tricarboxylate transporter receptor subunit TctC
VSFFTRAEVPDAHVKKLADAMQKILATAEAKEFVLKHGAEQMPLEPNAMATFQLTEYERLGKIAQQAGIKPE